MTELIDFKQMASLIGESAHVLQRRIRKSSLKPVTRKGGTQYFDKQEFLAWHNQQVNGLDLVLARQFIYDSLQRQALQR